MCGTGNLLIFNPQYQYGEREVLCFYDMKRDKCVRTIDYTKEVLLKIQIMALECKVEINKSKLNKPGRSSSVFNGVACNQDYLFVSLMNWFLVHPLKKLGRIEEISCIFQYQP